MGVLILLQGSASCRPLVAEAGNRDRAPPLGALGERERRQPKGHRPVVVAARVVIQPVGPGRGLAQPTVASSSSSSASSNDDLTIVLVEPEPADMPTSVVIHGPPAPTISDPGAVPWACERRREAIRRSCNQAGQHRIPEVAVMR